MIVCKECQTSFENEKSLHSHLRKHKLKKSDYYQKYFPKICLYTGKKIPFKNSDDLKSYLSRHFVNEEAMYFYFLDTNIDMKKKTSILEEHLLKMKEKSDLVPCQFELSSSKYIPDINILNKYFNYVEKCKEFRFKDRFDYNFDYYGKLPITKISIENFCIIIDSREQDSLHFFSSIRGKLNVGDYAIGGNGYNKVHVERKSIGDAGGTFAKIQTDEMFLSRFEKELIRAREDGIYLIILIESSIIDFKKYRFFGFAQSEFIMNRMRYISRSFSDCCQLVFAGGRNQCQNLLPALLLLGENARIIDLQLWCDINQDNLPKIFSKEDLIKIYEGR